jgi:hypothetical protein
VFFTFFIYARRPCRLLLPRLQLRVNDHLLRSNPLVGDGGLLKSRCEYLWAPARIRIRNPWQLGDCQCHNSRVCLLVSSFAGWRQVALTVLSHMWWHHTLDMVGGQVVRLCNENQALSSKISCTTMQGSINRPSIHETQIMVSLSHVQLHASTLDQCEAT